MVPTGWHAWIAGLLGGALLMSGRAAVFALYVMLSGAALAESVMPPADARELALIASARAGRLENVEALLKQGARVDAVDSNGVTALVAAAYNNQIDVARRLLAAGADLDHQDRSRQNAFLIAASEGYLDLLKFTIGAGADVRKLDSYNGTALIRAAHPGHFEIVRELLKTGIDVNHVNRLGWTALLDAIILGDGSARYVETVRLLVENSADINLADRSGVPPMRHAEQRGYKPIVDILTKAGAR
ncbi:MAG: ankyrin repeat domain-containing protein [Alphaproteobacteria bacterium]